MAFEAKGCRFESCRVRQVTPAAATRCGRTFSLATLFLSTAFLGAPRSAGAQNFSFDVVLESPPFADFDRHPAIDGAEGEAYFFTANLVLASAGVEGRDGPQGWSVSFRHAGVELELLTVAGTVSATESEGGLRSDGELDSFMQLEEVDPARNEGRTGFVQAVVLSFYRPVTLPPNTRQVIARVTYRAAVAGEPRVAFVGFEQGLQGTGLPVENELTFASQTHFPSLRVRNIPIGSEGVPESGQCDDGIDNDGDGAVDADDPDCQERPPPEICDDGTDNDGDGATDCDDAECLGVAPCPALEQCDDGADNDGDGSTDCDDPDCRAYADCREVEDCADGIDNDLDGLTDCDDSQCSGVPPCPEHEVCDDGVDNDADGLTDCDDADCALLHICRSQYREDACDDGLDNDDDGLTDCDDPDCAVFTRCIELCEDGIDNDRNGLVDCEDPDCKSLSVCRAPDEDCTDGIDNDLDGRTDCDDPQCAGIAPCPEREICEGGVDEDGDGLVDCDDPSCADLTPCGGAGDGFDFVLHSEGSVREEGAQGAIAVGAAEREGPIHLMNAIDVSYWEEALLDVTVFIVPFPEPQPAGVQGWTLSIAHDRDVLDLEDATIAGTDAAGALAGGFEVTGPATSGGGGGGDGGTGGGAADGFVSAVVTSLTKPVTLDPAVAQSVAKGTYRLRDSLGLGERRSATIRFEDGLRGQGQPIENKVTVSGSTERPVHLVSLEVRRIVTDSAFIRGDANDDGRVDLADAIWSLNGLVRGGPPTLCPRAADFNDDGVLDLSDAVFLVQYLFVRGPTVPQPYPTCGRRGRRDLDCPPGSVAACF